MWSSISWKEEEEEEEEEEEGGGLISVTTVDSWKGCWGISSVFSVCVFGGDEVES